RRQGRCALERRNRHTRTGGQSHLGCPGRHVTPLIRLDVLGLSIVNFNFPALIRRHSIAIHRCGLTFTAPPPAPDAPGERAVSFFFALVAHAWAATGPARPVLRAVGRSAVPSASAPTSLPVRRSVRELPENHPRRRFR